MTPPWLYALLAIVGPILPVALGYWITSRKRLVPQAKALEEIKVVVNGRLDAALGKIERLEAQLGHSRVDVQGEGEHE